MRHTADTILAAVARENKYDTEHARRMVMDTYAIAIARWAEEHFGKPLSVSPRSVFEWPTGYKWDDLDAARTRLADLGEAASIDLCNGYRWITQMMDWVATHMAVNPHVCFRCAETAVNFYSSLPVCARCLRLATKVDPKMVDKDVAQAQRLLDSVFAKSDRPRPAHHTVCTNPRIRHSYLIRTPVGYLQYDGTYVMEMHQACRWTKAEVEMERAPLDDLETPVSIIRVVR